MQWYLLKPPVVKRSRSFLALVSILCFLGGCGLRFGAGPAVVWRVGMVDGSLVEPGLREQLQSGLRRSIRYRGIQQGEMPLHVAVEGLFHRRALASTMGADVAWRSELILVLGVAERPGCEVRVRVERVWLASAREPDLARINRAQAVEKLAHLASERGLDRLLGEASCR